MPRSATPPTSTFSPVSRRLIPPVSISGSGPTATRSVGIPWGVAVAHHLQHEERSTDLPPPAT
ncbi:hypothetical protein AV521_44380 [Streptomyces sp. IMTB 2501]|nr:hypothetical protein AV521_44380 [Streptomyces sp. IMTB 2501]